MNYKNNNLSISILGAGNVAWHVTKQLFACGYVIDCIFSRNLENAQLLAKQVDAQAINDIKMLPPSDLYLFSVKDNAYEEITAVFPKTTAICIHTSGSLDMNILAKCTDNYGVIYPFQSFSKEKTLDFKQVPLCVEASNAQVENVLAEIAHQLSPTVHFVNSRQRAYLHLAGVFASNFTNAMYAVAQEILQQNGMDFSLALPLINETAQKANKLYPSEAQTGPAVRNDENIITKHATMIKDNDLKELYLLISKIIKKQHFIL